MKRLTIAICILLFFVLTSAATTPTTSNASLKGTYVFMISNTKTVFWGQTLTCGGNPTFQGGSRTEAGTVMGTMTFDGSGGVTGSFNEYGKIDQTSSDNSVSCGNNGNAVFFAAISGTFTGSYSVQANGTGTFSVTPTGSQPVTFNLLLVGNCASTGVNDAFLITVMEANNKVGATGSARLQ